MEKNLYSQMVKQAEEAYARFDAMAAAAKKAAVAAEAEAKAAAAKAAASQEALNQAISNAYKNWAEIDPRTKMFFLLVLPLRVAKKSIHDYGVLRWYLDQSMTHEKWISRRDKKALLSKPYVNKVRALAIKISEMAKKESPKYLWLMSEVSLLELLKQPKKK